MEVQPIPLNQIDVSEFNTRKDLADGQFDSTIEDLARSIEQQTLLQPITVFRKPDGRFALVAGQRRLLPHKFLCPNSRQSEQLSWSGPPNKPSPRCGLRVEDPAQTPEAKAKRAMAISQRARAAREWKKAHPGPHNREQFMREVLPRLVDVTLPAMVKATGLTSGYCFKIKHGERVPHPMDWAALQALASEGPNHGIDAR